MLILRFWYCCFAAYMLFINIPAIFCLLLYFAIISYFRYCFLSSSLLPLLLALWRATIVFITFSMPPFLPYRFSFAFMRTTIFSFLHIFFLLVFLFLFFSLSCFLHIDILFFRFFLVIFLHICLHYFFSPSSFSLIISYAHFQYMLTLCFLLLLFVFPSLQLIFRQPGSE